MATRRVVELADRRSWSRSFEELAREVAARGSLEDQWLAGDIDDDSAFVAGLDGRFLRTYHCTRLTLTEIAWVRDEGLRPLSPDSCGGRLPRQSKTAT